MRGYVTFVLAASALVIFIYLANFQPNSVGTTPLIIERAYQQESNAKELLMNAVEVGAAEGLRAYAVEMTATGKFDSKLASEIVKEAIYRKLLLVAGEEFEGEIVVWCGPVNEAILRTTLKEMEQGTDNPCDACVPLTECRDYVQVEVMLDTNGLRADVGLGARGGWADEKAVGISSISSYGNAVQVGSISYIPASEKKTVWLYEGTA